jgi:polyphosphate kinase 2 (PPK2 family)
MLENVDLTLSLDKDTYQRELISNQVALSKLAFQVYLNKRPVIMVFEGWDAAGKGGVIKRLTEKMDPRGYTVFPIAAPQGDDKTHHYMWRFWRRLPETGQIAIFDRSWYGRIMVERVEGFCNETEWIRAYREINQFERQLIDFGTIILKFWIHISKEEQLTRFQERSSDKLRSWKLTDEDWRNREKWDLYENAVNDMLLKTSTIHAPWTVVEGNSKYYARVKVIRTVVDKLSKEFNIDPNLDEATMKTEKKKNTVKGQRKS